MANVLRMIGLNPMTDKILNKTKKFPDAPGVYFWLGKNNEVLYIGRATSLKKRIAQYFRKDIDPRIAEMVNQAKSIKYQPTENILDSVVLEAKLIKKYWPKYNVKDKDNRSFVYIVLTAGAYPRPMIVRERELKKFPANKNRIFGPYQSASLINNALKVIRRIFPYSTCRPNQGRPCFDQQIGLCPGSCIGAISCEDYQKNIKNISLLLGGQKTRLVNKLKKENPDKLAALKHIQDVTLITRDEITSTQAINRIEGYDISHWSGRETYGAMSVFRDGRPDKSQYRLFSIREALPGDDLAALAETLLRRFRHLEWPLPDLILIDGGKPQVDYAFKILRKSNIATPIIGLSKFGGDKLVFPPQTKKSIKDLAANSKNILLQVRDEAHRFGNRASRQKRRRR